MDGTVAELANAITEDHPADIRSRAGEPRFSALFGTTRKRAAAVSRDLTSRADRVSAGVAFHLRVQTRSVR